MVWIKDRPFLHPSLITFGRVPERKWNRVKEPGMGRRWWMIRYASSHSIFAPSLRSLVTLVTRRDYGQDDRVNKENEGRTGHETEGRDECGTVGKWKESESDRKMKRHDYYQPFPTLLLSLTTPVGRVSFTRRVEPVENERDTIGSGWHVSSTERNSIVRKSDEPCSEMRRVTPGSLRLRWSGLSSLRSSFPSAFGDRREPGVAEGPDRGE